MPYDIAINKAWDTLKELGRSGKEAVPLLSDTYEVSFDERSIFSNSCNVKTKDFITLLILHYLIGSIKNHYTSSGEWISFKEVEGGESYFSAYRKGSVLPLLRKFGSSPENLSSCLARFQGEKIPFGDSAVELVTFPGVRVRVILWKADSEFGPEAQILFDKNITRLYQMEDIAVFSHFIVSAL